MLKLSQPNISEAAISAVANVLRSGQLVHGAEGEAFERELAAYLGCEDVVLVSSGTAALHISLLALEIGPGDAVIVPDFTFPATANVVAITGAQPVIVDVKPGNYNIDIENFEATIKGWQGKQRLRAVMPVHEFGCPAEMIEISRVARAHGLVVVEDAACALGAKYYGRKVGTFGDLACFSFHPRKTLTTGEGGAVASNNPDISARLRRLRNHGMERTPAGMQFFESATNYRLTNFQAALGRLQLPELDSWIKARQSLAGVYMSGLDALRRRNLLSLPLWSDGHSWQTFMVVLTETIDRQKVIDGLRQMGIESNLGAQSLSSIGLYGASEEMKVGAHLFSQGLALPLHEQMNTDDVLRVCAALTALLT